MLDQAHPETEKILTDRRLVKYKPFAKLVEAAAREQKIGAGRIFREIVGLTARKAGLTADEYFAYRVYRADLSRTEKREFVGARGSFELNRKLSPPGLTQMRGFLGDKFGFPALLQQTGLPTTEIQAAFTTDRFIGSLPALKNATDIVSFLSETAKFPLFGKPVKGAQALGTIRIDAVDAASDIAKLHDGRVVAISALSEEIVRDFPDGYLFQSVVEQHPVLTETAGEILATMRMVTVIEDTAPTLLYALWKMPSPKAMSDNFWQDGSMLSWLNVVTGQVERCVTGGGSDQKEISIHPVSGKDLLQMRMPHWAEATDLVKKAHALFPVNGCLGWDVAIGKDGPLIVECNTNPGHDFYQIGTGRGALNPEMQAVFSRVIARNKAMIASLTKRKYKIGR
ncbi:Sugar-transfer associated ATP-grasp [Roseovarius nanhaiticus]|uniref:Sugar-transfer associated ATP-grasp n=1 Tax=Roseovarius nanhaiticus TaxID=573024 RepID=A0A1N7H6Z5_9RHOB|nr:sugar-transfer associated ATP-grasp domain-containing protein [Roseovarius nanhaiticus]SEL11107.1 Sugar-transfer associated ATP-grasp [Roseovarius nanhaiticus]SIS20428.1 Sugar-transfer associated ATP-grasp [Roseovarius nanhaiticus]